MKHKITCHEECLKSANRIIKNKRLNKFTTKDIIKDFSLRKVKQSNGKIYSLNTISTHMSRCCKNSPQHHKVKYKYFIRLENGVYEINEKYKI